MQETTKQTEQVRAGYYNILFHLDKGEAELKIALNNIRNYFIGIRDLGVEASAVLVVNGPGVQWMGKDGEYAAPLLELVDQGLSIRVCRNALNNFHLESDWLLPCCRVVSAGVLEIIDLQRAGYAYLKP